MRIIIEIEDQQTQSVSKENSNKAKLVDISPMSNDVIQDISAGGFKEDLIDGSLVSSINVKEIPTDIIAAGEAPSIINY